MNKHLYRIVFNHALGLCQVVSELVRRPGRGASASEGMRTANVRPVSLGLWVAFGWIGLASVATAGQIAGDPNAPGNQRPTVLGAPGSAPLINIQTPSAAGVSRNTYSQFDVGQNGAVLNNSRSNTQTQLAGAIAGNPWLATGTAKIILNEVTGSNPSQLNGYVEVAGDRAQVIIANPAGIACNGCGFINANRVTLTTGTPLLSGGALDGYRVSGGAISVGGTGLDASRADYTDIITRALQVNAGIWAPQLQVTTGSNQVSADQTLITPISGKGPAPTFAVDVSTLGGMYANKIQLLGTEHGVGVRNAGSIGAQAGELTVTVDGRLENSGNLQSQGDTQVAASGGIANAGTIGAVHTLTISTPQDLDNSHGTLTAARLDVIADSLRNQGGTITQTGAQAMTLQAGALSNRSGGSIGIADAAASGDTGSGGPSSSAGTDPSGGGSQSDGAIDTGGSSTPSVTPPASLADGALHIASLLDNDGGHITANAGFDLDTASGLSNDGGRLELRQLSLSGGSLSNNGGTLVIDGGATIHANTVANDAGLLTFNGPLSLAARQLSNRAGTIQQLDSNATSLSVVGTFDNTAGTLASNATSLAITSGTLINERGTINHAGLDGLRVSTNALYGAGGKIATAGVILLTAGAVDHRNATLSATQVTVNAASFDNRGGTITASGDAANTLTVTGTLDNGAGGTLASNGGLTIQASVFGNASGTVQQAGDGALTIHAARLNGAGGTIGSNGSLTVTGDSTDLSDGTTTAQQIAITTGTLSTAHGNLTAVSGDPLLLSVRGAYDNTQGTVATNGALQLSASSLDNTGGTLTAAGSAPTLVQVTHSFNNTGGTLGALGATTIQAGNLLNQGGAVQTGHGTPLTLAVTGLLDNSSGVVVTTDGDLSIRAAALDNTDGHISHAGQGSLTINAATLNGSNGSIASNGTLTLTGHATNLSGGTTQAQSIAISTGSLSTAGGHLTALGGDPLQLTVRGAFDNTGGSVIGNGALALSAASVNNTNGTLIAAGTDPTTLQVTGLIDNTGGTLASAGATTLHAGSLINTNGTVQASSTAPLTLAVDGLLVNDQGTLQSNGDIALTAGSISNHGGTVQTPGAIHAIVAGTLDNSAGAFIAGADLAVQADSLLNRDTLNSTATTGLYGKRVTLNAGAFDNSHGAVVARGALTVSGNALSNVAGVMDGQGTVSLTGNALDNTGGQLSQHGAAGSLTVDIAQALDNTGGGMIGAEGSAQLHAGVLDNSAGTIVAQHDLNLVSDGDLINTHGGVLQTKGALTLSANGSFDNSNGQLDVTGAATLSAASVSNSGGQLLAGDVSTPDSGLQITTGSLDNRGGTLGNRGGDVVLNAASIDNSAAGTLVAQRDLTLNTNALNNADGTTFATRNLSYQNASGALDNTGGQFGAGDTAWLNLAQITNNGGHVQADTLWLTTPTLNNDGGEVDGTTAHATFASLNGIGRLYGADLLDAHITGDYTHLAGQRLESDGVLSLSVDGTLTNQGTLQTPGELDITAANLINTNGAVINASAVDGSAAATINVSGTIDNQQGASLEGDTLNVTANTVSNTGNIIGDAITINAASLTNGRDLGTATAAVDYGEGFIGASQTMELHVGTLANLDGELYSGGDLSIAADAAGNQAQSVLNSSGLIQAEGNLSIAAQQITNRRRTFQTEVVNLTPAQQAQNTTTSTVAIYRDDDPNPLHHPPYVDPSQVLSAAQIAQLEAFCGGQGSPGQDGDQWCNGIQMPGQGDPHDIYHNDLRANVRDTLVSVQRLVSASAAGQLVSGGDMSLTGAVLNDKAAIAAGGNLTIVDPKTGTSGPGAVTNIAWAPTGTVQETTAEQTGIEYVDFSGGRHWDLLDYQTWGTTQTRSTVSLAPGSAPGWATYDAGPGLASTITANGSVTIVAGNVTNTVVGGSGGTGSITTGGLAGPGNTALNAANQANATTTTTTGGASAGAASGPGHQNGAAAQTIGHANNPLPGYTPPNNAMVVQHADPDAPFLVTTAPRFAKGASTSSDYLLQSLGYDPANMQKRLGDGYYEQSLVMDQILQLTGRRSLNGNGDAMAQYNGLMTDAARQAGQLGLSLGAPLTSAQIGALTSDIVWLVDTVVDGQHVLTPVVYLSKATADRLKANGALIAGDQVAIQSSTTLTNDGTISSDHGTWLSADTLINTGAIKSGGQLAIATRNDTINSGTLSAQSIALQAGRDLINTGSITSTGDMALTAGRDLTTGVAPIQAGGNLSLVAGRDLTATASTIHAGGDAQLVAGNNLNVNATAKTTRSGTPQNGRENLTTTTSSVTAGGNLALVAGNNLTSQGAQLTAGNQLGLAAGNDITLNAVTNAQTTTSQTQQGHTRTNTSTYDESVHGTTLSGTNGVAVTAGHDLTATAATISSTNGNVAMSAGHDLTLNTAQENHSTTVDTVSHGGGMLSKSKTTTHDAVSDSDAVGTAISGNNVSLVAGHNLTAQAAQVSAKHGLALVAGNDVNLLDANDVHAEEHDKTVKKSSAFGSNLDVGHPGKNSANATSQQITDTTVQGTTLTGGDGVVITAGNDVNAMAASITSANGAVGIHAGRDVNLLADAHTYSSSTDSRNKTDGHFYGSKTVTTHDSVSDTRAVGTTISGHSGVLIDAGRDVLTVGGAIKSDAGGIGVTAGDQIAMLAATSTHDTDHTDKTREAGFEQAPNMHQGTRKQEVQTEQVTAQGTTLDAHGPIVLASGGDQTYQAVNVHSDTGTALISGGAINLVTATNSDMYSRDSGKHNVAYQAQDHSGHIDTTEQQSFFSGPLGMAAADGITVGIGQKQGETQAEAIARSAGANPASAWLYAAQDNPNVTWQSVGEQQTQWHQHQEGLTSSAAAVATIVATYFTAGLASGAVASISGAAAGSGTAMAAAGASATGTAVSAGFANAAISGAIAGGVGGAVNAGSQGYDWKTAALHGAITGGLTGYLSAGTYYDNPINSVKEAGSYIATDNWDALGKMGLHIVTTQAAGRAEEKAAKDLGLSGDQLNWILMAGSIAGNELPTVGSRFRTVDADHPDGYESFDKTAGSGVVGYNNRGTIGLAFDTIDMALNFQGLPDASVAAVVNNQGASGVNQAAPNDLTCHSLGTATCSYLGWNGLVHGDIYLASVPLGVVAPPNATVIIGNGDAVNGFYVGKLFNWSADIKPIDFITGHPFENYKTYIDEAASKK